MLLCQPVKALFVLLFAIVTCALVSVQGINPVDKIHFEVNASPSGHSVIMLEALWWLPKVFGYPCNVIICAPALMFYQFKFSCLQEVNQKVRLSFDSGESKESPDENLMEVC